MTLRTCLILCLLYLFGLRPFLASPAAAQPDPPEALRLMSTAEGVLGPEMPSQTWEYAPGPGPSTIVVEVIEGTLDPAVALIGPDGEAIASNDDYAPAFGPDARLVVPGGDVYLLRIEAAFGAGRYRVQAIPGEMHTQWAETLTMPGPYWADSGAARTADGLLLESGLAQTRLFVPQPLPQNDELYVQARLRFAETRDASEAGLVIRGRTAPNGQVTGLRLTITPAGDWFLRANDIAGEETLLDEGRVTLPEVGGVTLGLLAQADRVAAYAEGRRLTDIEAPALDDQIGWGVVVTASAVSLQQLRLALPLAEPPGFPIRLDTWDAARPADIVGELAAADIVSEGGTRQFLLSAETSYTVMGPDQRNFLITDPDAVYDGLILGGDVTIQSGQDVGCGLVAGFVDRAHKLLAFADTQNGGGLFWWQADVVQHNNYARLTTASGAEYRLLLIQQDQFTALYVNGVLAAQSIIPPRAGALGVGFINYAAEEASCSFENVWLWD
ncbi:MAG: hypothetical protein ACLFTK_11760 [Anaerolineales bacterium]